MDGEREVITDSFLSTNIISSDFWVGATSTESRFRVGFVFGVSIASSRSSSHFRLYWIYKIFLPQYKYIFDNLNSNFIIT